MADPAKAPAGSTVFPATGVLGQSTPTVAPETLVGQEVQSFDLGLSATGTVVAADSAPVTAIAQAAVHQAIDPDHELVEGSVDVEVGDAIVVGQTVSFPVTVTADQIAVLDPTELEAMVLGKSVDEATDILEPYGEVEISVSPDWSGSIPSFESRVAAHDRRARDHRDPGSVRVGDAVTRWLGIDLGEKRVGLAVADGDAMEAIARPLVDAPARPRRSRRTRRA